MVRILTLTAVLLSACMSAETEARLERQLAASYYVSAPLGGTELASAYVPQTSNGLELRGARWRRVIQFAEDPMMFDQRLRARPGPGYQVRPSAPMRRYHLRDGERFDGAVQLCGADGLIVSLSYHDLWMPVVRESYPTSTVHDGRWAAELIIGRYGAGTPRCMD